MSIRSWLHTIRGGRSTVRQVRPGKRLAPQLGIEQLEDRKLMNAATAFVTIQGMPPSSAEGMPLHLSANVSGADAGSLTYAWSVQKNGQAFLTTTTPTLNFTPDDNGSYQVMLAVADGLGASGSNSVTLDIDNMAPEAMILGTLAGNNALGVPISLSSQVHDDGSLDQVAGFDYDWAVTLNGAPVTTGSGASFQFTPTQTGVYLITLQATDKDGDSGSDSVSFAAGQLAAGINISGGGNTHVEGTPVQFTSTIADTLADQTYTYAWAVTRNGQTVATGSQANFSYTPPVDGNYEVTLQVGNSHGDTTTAQRTLPVGNRVLSVGINEATTQGPEGTAISLSSAVGNLGPTGTTGLQYSWSVLRNGNLFASGDQASFQFTPDNDGTYLVRVTVTDPDGGLGTAARNIVITDVPPTLTITGSENITPGSAYQLNLGVNDPGADPITSWSINWGDGQVQTILGSPATASHTYALGSHSYTIQASATNATGTFQAGNSVAVSQDLGSENRTFLSRVYEDLLERPIDAGGLAYWNTFLDGGVPRAHVTAAIMESTEFRTLLVNDHFNEFLNRPADAAGRNSYLDMLRAGATIEQVDAALVGSTEYFQQRGGGTVDGFLTALYQDVLNRALDADGRTYYKALLAAGATREEVAGQVLASREYHQGLVHDFYESYLGRNEVIAGTNYWVQCLQQGDRIENVLAGILGTSAYATLTNPPTANQQFVSQVYRDLVGRLADPTSMGYWTTQLNQGLARTQLVLIVQSSTEYRTHLVDTLYQDLLGRAADSAGLAYHLQMLANGKTSEDVKAALLGSPEYFQRHGGNNDGFLHALYEDVTGHPLAPSNTAPFGISQTEPISPPGMAALAVASIEGQQGMVRDYYQRFLHRTPETAGLQYWVTLRQQGQSPEQILAGIVASTEFANHM